MALKIRPLLVSCFFLIMLSCSSSKPKIPYMVMAHGFDQEKIEKIAFITDNSIVRTKRSIEDVFTASLLSKKYKVASRSDVDRILQEMKFQQSGLTDADARKIGKILNVPAVLIGSVPKSQEKVFRQGSKVKYVEIQFSARLIDVESSEVLWISSLEGYDDVQNAQNLVQRLASAVADSFPSRY
jgi:TolB-like protein